MSECFSYDTHPYDDPSLKLYVVDFSNPLYPQIGLSYIIFSLQYFVEFIIFYGTIKYFYIQI
jgi:hypothetical protein